MNKKNLIVILLALPLLFGLTGCSGGVNGEGTSDHANDVGVPIVRGNSFNDAGWGMIDQGQYESSIVQFNTVLSDSPTPDEKAEANNGIGWARTRMGELKDGMEYFLKAKDISDDAKVGLASYYLQQASRADMDKVIDLLFKQLGKGNERFAYTARRNTGVSDAEVHAMLAYAYAATGDNEKAQDQIDYAKELNPNWENTTIDQLAKTVDFLIQ